jgi:hypothetical protein
VGEAITVRLPTACAATHSTKPILAGTAHWTAIMLATVERAAEKGRQGTVQQRVTASKLTLARHCIYPWSSGKPWDDSAGYSARIGTWVHKACELDSPDPITGSDMTPRAKERALGMYAQYRKWFEAYSANWNRDVTVHKEEAVYYCPATGKAAFLNSKHHRDYSGAPEGAICATLDMRMDGRDAGPVTVIDLKTGWSPERPDDSWQMKFQALALSKLLGMREVTVGILALREHDFSLMTATFSDITLDLVECELRRIHKSIRNNEGPNPGEQCRYCPIRQDCESSRGKKKR